MITTYDVRWALRRAAPGLRRQRRRRRPGVDRGRPAARPRDRDAPSPRPASCGGSSTGPTCSSRSPRRRRACRPSRSARRGHQRQRHADLLPRALPRGDGGVPRRARAGPRRRPRPVASPRRSPPSSSAGSTPRSTSGSTSSAPTEASRAARQGRDRQRPARLPGATSRSSAPTAGRRWPPPGPSRSGRCGPRPASRTRRTTTRCTSSSSSRRGVVNTMPEATLDAVADHGVDPRRHGPRRTTPTASRLPATTLAAIGIDYDDVVEVLEDEAVEKFEISWNELLDVDEGRARAARRRPAASERDRQHRRRRR